MLFEPSPADRYSALFATAMSPAEAGRAASSVARRFPGFAEAVSAPFEVIEGAAGRSAAVLLSAVRDAATALAADRIRTGDMLTQWHQLLDYVKATMSRERVEQFRVLFLDGRNRLIADEVQGTGTINHAPAYPREVVRRALMLDAGAVILVHNHPSGIATPSREDVALTLEIKRALETVGITLHDHLIVGDAAPLSFRQEQLI